MKTIRSILIIMVAIFVAGCTTTGSRIDSAGEAPKMLDVAMALKFEDIPIPAGFHSETRESFTFENDVLRVGILKYAGKAQANQVVDFYKDQMPLYNWRFLNMLEYGRRILNFDRDDQSCIIVIEPVKSTCHITITVAPKARRASTYKPVNREED